MTQKIDIKQVKKAVEAHAEEVKAEPTKEDKKEIRVIERIIENREIAPQDAFGKLTRQQISLIKTTIAKGASDDELRLFIQVCKGANLNPFLKQVFLVPRWDSKLGKEVRAIQVSIDGFRSIAESSGAYAGNDDPIFEDGESISVGSKKTLTPSKATVTVYKIVDGQRYPFTATARWSEYYPGEKMGFQWHIRPFLMLGKCAEALALRKAFPKLLSGMYAQEEMDRGTEPELDQKRIATGFKKLLALLDTEPLEVLKEWKGKIEKSDKYTEDQKAQFCGEVEKRLKEAQNKK